MYKEALVARQHTRTGHVTIHDSDVILHGGHGRAFKTTRLGGYYSL